MYLMPMSINSSLKPGYHKSSGSDVIGFSDESSFFADLGLGVNSVCEVRISPNCKVIDGNDLGFKFSSSEFRVMKQRDMKDVETWMWLGDKGVKFCGRSVLVACKLGADKALEYLVVKLGVNFEKSYKPLYYACKASSLKCVKILIAFGLSVDNPRALEIACLKANGANVVDYLAGCGANVNNKYIKERVCFYGCIESIKLLVKWGGTFDPHFIAIAEQRGHVELVSYLTGLQERT